MWFVFGGFLGIDNRNRVGFMFRTIDGRTEAHCLNTDMSHFARHSTIGWPSVKRRGSQR